MSKAYGYLRVSGKAQAGDEKDGLCRQETAIREYAGKNGYTVTQWFQDVGISGKSELDDRPALQALLVALVSNGVRTVIIEKLDRLARDLMIQETIIADMRKRGFTIISVAEPDLLSDDPSRIFVRQIFGAFAEYERKMIVSKLKAARDRKKAKYGKCEGRKKFGEKSGEKKTLEKMKELHLEGKKPHRIATFFNQNLGRYPTATTGCTWTETTIKRILKREGIPHVVQ